MAVFTEESAKANVRVRNGKRVFYLAESDILTPSARQWLQRDQVEILPAAMAKPDVYRTLQGAIFHEKPEHMTHLQADVLVPKDHPRIVLRGLVDQLETELILTAQTLRKEGELQTAEQLDEVVTFVQKMMRCEVTGEPFEVKRLCGLTAEELREHSHFPQKYYGMPHFIPNSEDHLSILLLNRLRSMVRRVEIGVCAAFLDQNGNAERSDLIQGYNRLSSLLWILMIRKKKEEGHGNKS